MVQPGVPVYQAYPQLLLSLNQLGTLQQRVGSRALSADLRTVSTQGLEGLWLRTDGMHGSLHPDAGAGDADQDYDLWRLQAGIDGEIYRNDDGRLIAGLTAQYGTISGDLRSLAGNGDISTSGYGVGATLTWYGERGFYVDAQGQTTFYDSNLRSDAVGTALADGNTGFGYALSLEAGQRFDVAGAWSVTPQAQLVYSSVDFGSFNDPFGARVSLDRGDSLNGRMGLALNREESWQAAGGGMARAQFYGAANLYYEFLDGVSVDVAGSRFASRGDEVWAGLTLGGSYSWGDERFSVHGEVSAKSLLKDAGDNYALGGSVGFRVRW
ncbi:outer membrane autotransporter barrel domain protein [Rhizobium sp. CF080]|nr:outer membrane autotransporter barrel domain protein [Rhizobium sp. CF080]